MLDYKTIAKNSGIAIGSQLLGMLASIATTLLVPKLLGVEAYGYWQLFIFFSSYLGFFHLGLVDGVYLINGGRTRNELDKEELKAQFKFSLIYECSFAVVIVAIGLFGPFELPRRIVIIWTALFLVLSNVWFFFGYLFQAINEPNIYSYSNMIDRLVYMVILVLLLVARDLAFDHYIIAAVVARTFAMGYCLYQGRDILDAPQLAIRKVVRTSVNEMKAGIKLTLASVTGMLIVGVVRMAIDMQWGIAEFGRVSLAISLINFILAFVQQVSMVLFPALRRAEVDEVSRLYAAIQRTIDAIAPLAFAICVPIALFVDFWLPAYAASMRFLFLLLPICIFDAKMELCCTTIFKVQRQESLLLKINIATVLLCIGLVAVASLAFRSIEICLVGVVLAVVFRSIYSESVVSRYFNVESVRRSVWTAVECFALSGAMLVAGDWRGYCILICAFALSVLMERELYKSLLVRFAKLVS